jgi:hypothetical protein
MASVGFDDGECSISSYTSTSRLTVQSSRANSLEGFRRHEEYLFAGRYRMDAGCYRHHVANDPRSRISLLRLLATKKRTLDALS